MTMCGVGRGGVGALVFAAVMVAAGAPDVVGQSPDSPFGDATAEALWRAAADHRLRTEDELVSYTAVVRQRVSAGIRMPLKDRTLYRAESAHRVLWDREGDVIVQVLALREQTPMGVEEGRTKLGLFDENFDPLDDRLFFGMAPSDDEGYQEDPHDFWFEHPLEPSYQAGYRYTVGDTLTLSLPEGRTVLAVELRVVPTEVDVHRMTGSLWIEPESGALVRAVYRLSDRFDVMRDVPDVREEDEEGNFKFVPPMLKPWGAEIRMIAVDYAMWDRTWLPRSLRAEGVISAGVVHAPAAIEVTYEIEDVVTEADLAASTDGDVETRHFETRAEAMDALARLTTGDEPYHLEPGWSSRDERRRPGRGSRHRVRYLVPDDPSYLLDSPMLPPPIWDDAPGFPDDADVEDYLKVLDGLPSPTQVGIPYTVRWGPQRPDLLRFNRVEGLSVGVRGQVRPQTPLGALSLTGSVRAGHADVTPSARLDITRETLRRRITVRGYSELAAADERARPLALGNSLMALLFGRDEGEYFRRSGAFVSWSPPSAERQTFEARLYGEYHEAVGTDTRVSVRAIGQEGWAFRPNIVAEEGWDVGTLVRLAPWWGTDPRMVQAGLSLELQGATGDFEYARSSLTGQLLVPLGGDYRAGFEAAGGTSWGALPIQRHWFLGGTRTLRGYAPSTAVGPAFVRGRAEVGQQFAFGLIGLFGEGGWAGPKDVFDTDALLYSVGTGLSLIDGLFRLDGAWGLADGAGFRLHFYMDGAL